MNDTLLRVGDIWRTKDGEEMLILRIAEPDGDPYRVQGFNLKDNPFATAIELYENREKMDPNEELYSAFEYYTLEGFYYTDEDAPGHGPHDYDLVEFVDIVAYRKQTEEKKTNIKLDNLYE